MKKPKAMTPVPASKVKIDTPSKIEVLFIRTYRVYAQNRRAPPLLSAAPDATFQRRDRFAEQ